MRGAPDVEGHRRTRWVVAALTAVALGLAFGAVLLALPADRFVTVAVDDLVQLLAPALAAVLCARTARLTTGADRRLWWWLAAATGAWALGQTVWSAYELLLRVEAPFPSPADIGFLAFPVLAATGLLLWHGGSLLSTGARDLIDGGLLAGALLILSWKTALGAVVAEGGQDALAFALSVAYPVGDLVSATVVLLLIARTGAASRPHVVLLAAGMLSLAVADSAYVYLQSQQSYSTGDLISVGWVTGFLLVGAAAVVATGADRGTADRRPARGFAALPYLAVLVALASIVHSALSGRPLPLPEVFLASGLAVLLMLRQYLVLQDNERLLQALTAREAALAHEVMHDGLTGLSNRAMLLQRLDQVLALHARDGRGLVVMFCDLDDFKGINDTFGHLAGDGVLREVAVRLRAGMRASDTVARYSGDEFAVIMEPPLEEPLRVAGRLINALTEPIQLYEGTVGTGVSIGIAVIGEGGTGRPVTARSLVAAADAAMYSAKSGGKNRAVMVEVGSEDPDRPADLDGTPGRHHPDGPGEGPSDGPRYASCRR